MFVNCICASSKLGCQPRKLTRGRTGEFRPERLGIPAKHDAMGEGAGELITGSGVVPRRLLEAVLAQGIRARPPDRPAHLLQPGPAQGLSGEPYRHA